MSIAEFIGRGGAIGLLLVSSVHAEFPTVFNTEQEAASPLLSPEFAAGEIQLPAGFHASAFAAEPAVQNPIDMAWDARGRLWIAENYTYAERTQRFELSLKDRVIILEDADGDGHLDKRTVFTDDVQMLTSVEVGHDGVWLMCPPNVLFVPDRNHDDVPDGPPEAVLDGFEVRTNYHNFANGLRWGPDGWLYGRCGGSCPGRIGRPGTPHEQRVALEGGMFRYHPQSKQVEVLVAGTTNPWGHDWNAMGEAFFVNTVNGHLWHLIPGAHFTRPFTLDPNPYTYELIDFHADHWHFDTGQGWQASRAGAANSYGGGHAHSGAMIYLGGHWPKRYHGMLFTLNLHGRRANVERLERHGSGYMARHEPDFFVSGDTWFRGMDLSYGPDGNVFVLDWSDTGECHETTGVHRTSGRVFKITYSDGVDQHPRPKLDLWTQSDESLVALHRSTNEWFVRQSRLVLAARSARRSISDDATAELIRMSHTANEVTTRLRSMLTLYTIGVCDDAYLRRRLEDPSEHVRAWVIRLLTDTWRLDDCMGPVNTTIAGPDAAVVSGERQRENLPEYKHEAPASESRTHLLALRAGIHLPAARLTRTIELLDRVARTDSSSLVRLTLASTLQRIPLTERVRLASAIVSHAEDVGDHNLPLMVWYGLMPVAAQDPTSLVQVLRNCRWPRTSRLIARRIAEQIDVRPESVDALVECAIETLDDDQAVDIVSGISAGLKGARKEDAPRQWTQLANRIDALQQPSASRIVRQLNVVFGSGRALAEVQRIALDGQADYAARRAALQTLVHARPAELRSTCAQLLDDARLNVIAARGLSVYNDPEIGQLLVNSYKRFRGPERPQVIAMLVSRRSYAGSLLDAIESQLIAVDDITAFDVRQIHSLADPQLSARVTQLWGEIRESSQDKLQAIESQKRSLTPELLASADRSQGRAVFNSVCAKCHRLYGEGAKIGPDLTGSNRSNLHYLLENVIDPSAVVSKDFRMTVLELVDGRVLNGLIAERNDRALVLQTQTDQVIVPRDEVKETHVTRMSAMPDGLLDALTSEQVRNLMAYLSYPSQVALP